MTNFRTVILSVLSMAMLAACSNNSYNKTPSGIMYKIVKKGDGPLVKKGEILKFHLSQQLNDSVMFTSFNSFPTYAKVDSVGAIYSPVEVLPFLHKGDSVLIIELADTLLKKSPPGQPSPLKKGDKLKFTLKILDIIKSDEVAQADQQKEVENEKTREDKFIESYLAGKKVNTQKTPKGVFVAVTNPGDGPAIDSGKYVSIAYTGKSFPGEKSKDEKVFETNVGKAPIQFTINSGQMIPGWDEGLKLLKKGGKATFYIPATMAYGQQPGPSGKPFENLIFDVEVVDVADKAPAAPAMPSMPPGQGMPQPAPGEGSPQNSGATPNSK